LHRIVRKFNRKHHSLNIPAGGVGDGETPIREEVEAASNT